MRINFIVTLLLLAAGVFSWRLYRRRPETGLWALIGFVLLAVAFSAARVRNELRPETAVVPRGVHYAAGFRLGELAAASVPEGKTVLVIRPIAEHPARAEIGNAQIEGIRDALRSRRARVAVDEFDLFAGEFATLSEPTLPVSFVRDLLSRHSEATAVISLCGAPLVSPADQVEGLPPIFALSFTDAEQLRDAFSSGWLRASVKQHSIGRDLDIRSLKPREVFDATFALATLEDARSGRIAFER